MRYVAFWMLVAGVYARGFGSELPRNFTLLLDFEGAHSPVSEAALGDELHSILSLAQLPIRLQVRTGPLQGDVPGSLVIFKMKGNCTMQPALPIGAMSDERGPLAMTFMANGEMLPFANVDCNRVRTSLERTLGRGSFHQHERQYGTALARVMAHELYHMLSRSPAHDKDGVTKKALTSRELSEGQLLFSHEARLSLIH